MKYAIHSKSERGWWNSEIGWCYDVDSATTFDHTQRNLPFTHGNDAEWICLAYQDE